MTSRKKTLKKKNRSKKWYSGCLLTSPHTIAYEYNEHPHTHTYTIHTSKHLLQIQNCSETHKAAQNSQVQVAIVLLWRKKQYILNKNSSYRVMYLNWCPRFVELFGKDEDVWDVVGGDVSLGVGLKSLPPLPVCLSLSCSTSWLRLNTHALSYCSSMVPGCLLPCFLPWWSPTLLVSANKLFHLYAASAMVSHHSNRKENHLKIRTLSICFRHILFCPLLYELFSTTKLFWLNHLNEFG